VSGLRFAMLATFYPPYHFGGDAMGAQRLAQALVRRGHHVTVIRDEDAYLALAGREPAAAAAQDGVEIVGLRSRLGALSPLLTQQLGRPVVHGPRIRRLLDEGRFDVTIFHNVSLVGGPGLLAMGRGVTLYLAHEHWLVCPTHVLWRHGREVCTGRQCLRCVLHHRRPPQLWRYTGYLERQLDHVDMFVAMSEFSRAKHREFGFPRDMEVLPYFLPNAELSAPDAEDAPHPRPYFLFVGRLERIKGLDDVVPVFAKFDRADLLIAGDGDYAATLRAAAAGNPRVVFLGRVAPADLARYYRHAAALIVPSVCYETFGIILIEAFRQGTPVIARRIGPFPEILERAGAGDVFDRPAELEAAMGRFLDDPARRQRLGAAGLQAFAETWSERVVVPRFLGLVRRAAEAKGDRRVAHALQAEVAA
jgi:glycosyltransferase involved in cell wall biosynthesis